MKTIITIIAIAILTGCSLIDDGRNSIVGTPLEGLSVDDAQDWISINIRYALVDKIDEWQSAQTTLTTRQGDCEDFCILLMIAMKVNGLDPHLTCYIMQGGDWHYRVRVGNDFYEAQAYHFRNTYYFERDNEWILEHILWETNYEMTMNKAVY